MTAKEIVRTFFKEGYENKNYDKIIFYLSEDYIDHSPAGARSNLEAVDILKDVATQFSDLKVEIIDMFSEDNMVATRVAYTGTHITGRKISFEALENFKISGEKIIESWGYWPDKEIEQKLKIPQLY